MLTLFKTVITIDYRQNRLHIGSRMGLTGILFCALSACSTLERPQPTAGDPMYAPVSSQSLQPRTPVNGAIFQADRNYGFYGDRIALNVGDILTVTLQEKTTASKSAKSSIDKDGGATFNNATILGTNITGSNLSLETDVDFEREFDGQAGADQNNSLVGSISVTVSEVLPNGILRIRGEKWLTLSQGDEYIRLTGLVRPEDIDTDNTIDSTKVADARIAYGGTGDFDQAGRMGWASRFFNSEWWPF